MPNDKRRGAANHEAGHAVVAWAVGCKVIAMCIEENGDGRTDTECDLRRMPFIDRLAFEYAGEVAQAMFDARTHEMAAAYDWGGVDSLLLGLSDKIREQLRVAGTRRAREALEHYRQNVERVATYLIAHGKLDAETFIRLFLNKN
jgi:hypothetical protein